YDLVPLASAAEVAAALQERQHKQTALEAKVKRLEEEKLAADKDVKEAEASPQGPERELRLAAARKAAEEATKKVQAARKERDQFAKSALPFETAYAMAEGKTEGKKKVGNACIQIKGDPERLGKEVPRRFLTVLGGQTLPADAKGSGRLELAGWL